MLLDLQVIPESADVETSPTAKATASFDPSADEAVEQFVGPKSYSEMKAVELFVIQVDPELVEVKRQDGRINAANLVPFAEEATEG